MAEDQFHYESLAKVNGSFAFVTNEDIYADQKPYYYSGPLEQDQEHLRTNLVYETVDTPFANLRGLECSLSLVNNGFEYIYAPTKILVQQDEAVSIRDYILETVGILKTRLKAQMCIAYSYRFRRAQQGMLESGVATGFQERPDEPINYPHVDQTVEGGFTRIKKCLSEEEQEKYLNGSWRIRIVNLWRPLYHMVQNDHLALCDPFTIDWETDLVPVDRLSGDRTYVGDTYYLRSNKNQHWYYLRDQKPEEMILFVSFDSDTKGIGPAYVPHASFEDPTVTGNIHPRESVEIRVIVISRKET